ncbi:hypothetical protein PUN28_000659 [Cardiocondyla obscurior]|uniref:Uncharacterized protein n=1 Tax=Cardiocondyla obscurior TaxID=286306 RepID=A0AAW2H0W1_9HYME
MTPGVVWQIHVHAGRPFRASSRSGKEVYRPGAGSGDGGDRGGGGGGGAGRAGLVNRSQTAGCENSEGAYFVFWGGKKRKNEKKRVSDRRDDYAQRKSIDHAAKNARKTSNNKITQAYV